MSWRIDTSLGAEKFLAKNKLSIEGVEALIEKALLYFGGQKVNVDIKKLKGEWKGFYRIRSGKIRIIAEFDFDHLAVFVEEIDWRGNVYK